MLSRDDRSTHGSRLRLAKNMALLNQLPHLMD